MKNKKKLIILGIVSILLIGSRSGFTQAGQDPLVTKSYVDSKIGEVKKYVDDRLGFEQPSPGGGERSIEVVDLSEGDYLIGAEGTEIILRAGRAKAEGVKVDAGLADLTSGVDIDNTTDLLPRNHLLLVPRTDGRGVYSLGETVFIVRGSYKVR